SRSTSVKACRLRRRSGGGRPPRCRICAWTVPGTRSSARPISLTDSPRRQRSHSSWRSSVENHLRFLATATPPSSTAAQCCDEGLRAPLLLAVSEREHRQDSGFHQGLLGVRDVSTLVTVCY